MEGERDGEAEGYCLQMAVCYCTYCCRDVLLNELEECPSCGLRCLQGMDPEWLSERHHNNLELIKALCSYIHKSNCLVRDIRAVHYDNKNLMKDMFEFPVVQGINQELIVKNIHDYVEKKPYDSEAAGNALREIAEMLTKGD